MQTMLLAPEVAAEHFALATHRSLDRIEKYLALGIELVGVGGDFSGTRPLISPEAYRHFIVPEVRILSRRLHQAGAFAVNASDGDLWPVIDDFLCGCEVDGYLEIDQYAGMDLRRLKATYGEKVCLFGNLDCGNALSFGTPESIRQETLDCLEAGRGQGGHILCASNAITASVSLENYLAVVHAYREWCGLPVLGLGR
jgi:uroporphyrinogen decarboxylase